MSVQRTDYVVVGVKLPDEINKMDLYDKFGDDGYDDLMNSVSLDSAGLISSPMDGAWTVAGVLITPTGNDYEGIEFTEIDIQSVDLQHKSDLVRIFCRQTFDIDVESKILAFTQWS